MAVVAPIVDVKDALALIACVEEREGLSHLKIKKYRNFLTVYSEAKQGSDRRIRLALRDDGRWQLHLPVAHDEWESTRLIAAFDVLTLLLVENYSEALGLGSGALREVLMRDKYVGPMD